MDDIKKLNEQLEQYNEESEIDIFTDDMLNIIDKDIDHLKEQIQKRITYRFKENVSYFGQEAQNKLEAVHLIIQDSLSKIINDVYNEIG